MEITLINTPALRAELIFLRSAMEAKTTMQSLQNFAFDFIANTNLVKILSSDLDLSASTIIECKEIAKKESCLVNGKKLVELLSDLPNNIEVNIKQLDTEWIQIKSGKSKYKIPGQTRENFPNIEQFETTKRIELAGLKFAEIVNNTQSVITMEDSQRFALNGAQLRITSKMTSIIALDGHRLAIASFPFLQENITEEIIQLIPKKALQQVKLMIDTIQGKRIPDLFFSFSEKQIRFELGTKTLYSRILSGTFPNYNLVLPKEEQIKISVNMPTVELRQAIKRVSKMSDGKTQGIKLFFTENLLTLRAQDSALGEGEESIDITNSEIFDIGVNSNYLMDFLNRVSSDNIVIKLKNPTSQCLLEPIQDQNRGNIDYKYVIMPMRI